MKNNFIFIFTLLIVSFLFADSSEASRCFQGYCVDTELTCGEHWGRVENYFPNIPASICPNVSCRSTWPAGYYSNTAPGVYINTVTCSGCGGAISDSDICRVLPGGVYASIKGPSSFSSSAKFIFSAGYISYLDRNFPFLYAFGGPPLVPGQAQRTQIGEVIYNVDTNSDCSSSLKCQHYGSTCCSDSSTCSEEPLCGYRDNQLYCYSFIKKEYESVGNCSLKCNQAYTLTARAEGERNNAISSKKITYTCSSPPPNPPPGPPPNPPSSYSCEGTAPNEINQKKCPDTNINNLTSPVSWHSIGANLSSCSVNGECEYYNYIPSRGECGDSSRNFGCNEIKSEEWFDNNLCSRGTSTVDVGQLNFPDSGKKSLTWKCKDDLESVNCQASRSVCGQSDWIEAKLYR